MARRPATVASESVPSETDTPIAVEPVAQDGRRIWRILSGAWKILVALGLIIALATFIWKVFVFISSIKDKIEALATEVPAIMSQSDRIETSIATLGAQHGTLIAQIDVLNSSITPASKESETPVPDSKQLIEAPRQWPWGYSPEDVSLNISFNSPNQLVITNEEHGLKYSVGFAYLDLTDIEEISFSTTLISMPFPNTTNINENTFINYAFFFEITDYSFIENGVDYFNLNDFYKVRIFPSIPEILSPEKKKWTCCAADTSDRVFGTAHDSKVLDTVRANQQIDWIIKKDSAGYYLKVMLFGETRYRDLGLIVPSSANYKKPVLLIGYTNAGDCTSESCKFNMVINFN